MQVVFEEEDEEGLPSYYTNTFYADGEWHKLKDEQVPKPGTCIIHLSTVQLCTIHVWSIQLCTIHVWGIQLCIIHV